MPKGFAIHNAPTDHGGVIPSTLLTMLQEDNAFVRAGDGHYCPQCKCWSTVVKSHDHMIMFGQPVAYAGDKLTCGATIQPQQTHMVGKSHSGKQNSEHNNEVIQNNSQGQNLTDTTHRTTSPSSLKSGNDDLTEDDKLLTEDESNQIFQRCFKQTVNPMTIEYRKLATEMYWSILEIDNGGVSLLGDVLENTLGKLGALEKPSKLAIASKIYSYGSSKIKSSLNDKRMKYFKVESFKTIDGRVAEAGQGSISSVQVHYKSRFHMLNAGI